ncbi:hypothetical protein BH24CHL6_BH24CHL6_08600 [soil metagenome]
MVANAVGDRIHAASQLLELVSEAGEAEGVLSPQPSFCDEGSQGGLPVVDAAEPLVANSTPERHVRGRLGDGKCGPRRFRWRPREGTNT